MLFYSILHRNSKKKIFDQIKDKKKKGIVLDWVMTHLFQCVCIFRCYCKRVFYCLSFMLKKKAASMSVEATLVMPFFLFALINLISVIEIYRLQSNLSAAMHRTVKEMAVYGYEYQEIMGPDSALKLESLGLTYLFGAKRVVDVMGEEYLEKSPIYNGANGINWLRSEILEKEECIDLIATYQVQPMIELMGFSRFSMCNRMRARAWTGFDISQNNKELEFEDFVYITEYGTVYHLSSYCTHLKLSIQEVDIERLGEYKNQYGLEYEECQRCFDEYAVTFYITDYGELAHCSLSCSSLKRTIELIPLDEVGDKVLCKKCKELYGGD